MPQIELPKNSTSQEIEIRFINVADGSVKDDITVNSLGLELWYRRDRGPKVTIDPVQLSAIDSDYEPGGLILIGNGIYRLDLPDAALVIGVDSVQIGGGADLAVLIAPSIRLVDPTPFTALSAPDPGNTEFIDCSVYLQEAPASTHEGCPVATKRRHVPVPKGVNGTVAWIMRKPSGLAANFTQCLAGSVSEEGEDHVVKVRFQNCDRGPVLGEVDAVIDNSDYGLIEFPIPEVVRNNSGIYQFQAALMLNDSPAFIDGGLISVEPGMWGNTDNMGGPPTIQEIRFAIRDRSEENDLLRAVEFDDADILEAVRWPVFQFNETPPDLGHYYSCMNFPFRYYWMQAIVARLLTAAAHHYVRNKMQAQSGGLTVDDKNKDADYLRFAGLYLEEWKEFVVQKKVSLNASLGFGSLNSMYGGYTGEGW
jgi:hypothetical protein